MAEREIIGHPNAYGEFKVTKVIVGPTTYKNFDEEMEIKENQIIFAYDDIACLSGTAGTYLFEIMPDGSLKLIETLMEMMS